jgi:hypothetical protein
MKTANLNYIYPLYYYVLSMSEEELDKFCINNEVDRLNLFKHMKRAYNEFGDFSKNNVILSIEFALKNKKYEKDEVWRKIIPHEIPIYNVIDRTAYLMDLYFFLTGLTYDSEAANYEILAIDELGREGLNIKN